MQSDNGKVISFPDTLVPEIKKLNSNQKKKHNLLAGFGVMFDSSDTVFHINELLQIAEQNESNISLVAEAQTKYIKTKKK